MDRAKHIRSNRVLVITEDSHYAQVIRKSLAAGVGLESYDTEWSSSLTDGIKRLQVPDISAIILDLSLSDSQGIETFNKVSASAPGVPVLVLSDPAEEQLAKQAVLHGAHDYLPKDQLNAYSVIRAVRSLFVLKLAAQALLGDQDMAEVTLNSIGDAVLSTDMEGKVTYLNAVAEQMTGWKRKEALGRPLDNVFRVINRRSRAPAQNPLQLAVEQNQTVGLAANSVLIRRDGVEAPIEDCAAPIRDRGGQVVGAVIVFRDVGEAHALARHMSHLAQHDFLTQLPNRILLNDRLGQAIAMSGRHHNQLAVMFVDLDHFKQVNDSQGHAIGDAVLQAVAERLRDSLRNTDTVSRYSGDEFVILLPEINDQHDSAMVAEKILNRLAAPYIIGSRELYVTASVGVSIYPLDSQDPQNLVQCADLAMYEAKKAGGGSYRFFCPSEPTSNNDSA